MSEGGIGVKIETIKNWFCIVRAVECIGEKGVWVGFEIQMEHSLCIDKRDLLFYE